MATISAVVGAVTSTTARVTAKVDTGPVRIATSTSSDLSSPTYHGPESVDADGVATVDVTGLTADTRYWWAVEDNGTLDTGVSGQLLTDPTPGQPASFTVALGGDAGLTPDYPGIAGDAPDRLSNHPVHDTIRQRAVAGDWRRFVHLGDICYYDLGSGNHGLSASATAAQYRTMWDDILAQPTQAALYRDVPLVYVWDDHDFGPNNSDSTAVGRDNACTVYRERVPSYDLPAGAGANPVYHSFTIGRVLFVVSDTRADRVTGSTMLGSEQISWLTTVLSGSDAELLVWLMPTPWIGQSSDTWAGYTAERAALIDVLNTYGWLDRMCMVSADKHVLALESGAGGNEAFGGFPIMLCASLDATPGTVTEQYDLGMLPGRNQYGTLDVVDSGSVIEVTLSGWQGTSLWGSHTFTVGEPAPTPTPTPSPEPVAVAKIRNRVTWLGCDLATGRIIAELPDITGQVSRVLGRYTSASLSTPIPLAGPGAVPLATVLQATQPARTMIVAVVNDIPTWAGIPLPRSRGTNADMPVGCVSIEGYLQHRFVRDHEWTQQDEASVIAAGLLADAGDIEGVGSGIGLVVDAPATGRLRDRQYLASDHKSVYDALVELMAVQGGPEWTIDLDWADSTMTVVTLIARVRSRVGVAAASPTAVFETTADSVFSSQGGADARYQLDEDYSADRYANYVVAYSSGEGEDQPTSDPALDQAALDAGAPIWEQHFQPSTSIANKSTLDGHAAAQLARVQGGASTLRITARWSAYPRYGVDWRLGDDIAYDLRGHGHPAGLVGQGRAVGFELDTQAGTIRPLLQEDA